MQALGDKAFSCIHVRRGDFQYHDTREDILTILKNTQVGEPLRELPLTRKTKALPDDRSACGQSRLVGCGSVISLILQRDAAPAARWPAC